MTEPAGWTGPGFWRHETSGVLRPAVEAYLAGTPMTPEQVIAFRAYLRQWIAYPGWTGAERLRRRVDSLGDRTSFERWLTDAEKLGIDPL